MVTRPTPLHSVPSCPSVRPVITSICSSHRHNSVTVALVLYNGLNTLWGIYLHCSCTSVSWRMCVNVAWSRFAL